MGKCSVLKTISLKRLLCHDLDGAVDITGGVFLEICMQVNHNDSRSSNEYAKDRHQLKVFVISPMKIY